MNNNKLKGDDLNILVKKCPNIRKLKMENNYIDNFEIFKNLLGLQLKRMNIKGNPCLINRKNYKSELFDIFLSLLCVDDCDKEGNDIESTEYGNEQNCYYEENNDESFGEEEEEENDLELNSNEKYLNMEEELENDNELDEDNDEDNDGDIDGDNDDDNEDDNKEGISKNN